MTPILLAASGLVIMLLLVFWGMPIGFSMLIAGLMGTAYFLGVAVALTQAVITFYGLISNYTMSVLPFFILMGGFAAVSGMSGDLYRFAEKWLRGMPGGLALATILGCAGFASICGSSAATAATMGQVALPEMRRYKYDDALSTGCVAAGGTLGFLIPPSAAFIIYAIITEQSPGWLLIAGFLPGLLLTLAFMVIIIIKVKLNPAIAPSSRETVTWGDKFKSLRTVWVVALIFLLVVCGMYFGVFTPTEAGAVGAFGLFISAIIRRKLSLRILFKTVMETINTTCMIFIILFGAYVFNDFIALSGVPGLLIGAVSELTISPYLVLLLILVVFLILGCFIESIPMMILLVPFVLPIIVDLGFSPLWFGVICILLVEAALITPPIGMNVFILSGVAKDVPTNEIFRGSFPFLAAIVFVILLLIPFPQIATFLPNTMMK